MSIEDKIESFTEHKIRLKDKDFYEFYNWSNTFDSILYYPIEGQIVINIFKSVLDQTREVLENE